MSKTRVMQFILVLCVVSVGSDAEADEADYSALHYFAAGVLLVDVGASMANGIALATE